VTFTYDLASADPTTQALSQVRFELGDTRLNRGVRADGTNISDEELAVVYAREGEHVMRTVAGLCEMLARDWARVASTAVGPRSAQYGQVSQAWAQRAAELRTAYGSTAGVGGFAFSVSPKRADGYADHATGAEYG
jgi:hypothetical protein